MPKELSLENVESVTIENPEITVVEATNDGVSDEIVAQSAEENPEAIIIVNEVEPIEPPTEGDLSSETDDQQLAQAVAEATIDLVQQSEIQSLSRELAQVRNELFQALQALQEQVNNLQESSSISSQENPTPQAAETEAEIVVESTAPPKKRSKSLLAKLLT